MLSKCANPACFARFRYLRQGKIFKIERHTSPSEGRRKAGGRGIEHFWLCESCEKVLTVICENGVVSTQPRPPVPAARVKRDEDEPDLGLAFHAGAGA